MAEVGVDRLRIVPLKYRGKLLYAVMVGGSLLLWCGQCGCEVAEEL